MRSEYIDKITNGATDPVKVAKALLEAGVGPADARAVIEMQFGNGQYNEVVGNGLEIDAKELGWRAYADRYLFGLMSRGKKAAAKDDQAISVLVDQLQRMASRSKVEVIDRSKVELTTSKFEASDSSKLETSGHADCGQAQISDSAKSLLSTSYSA